MLANSMRYMGEMDAMTVSTEPLKQLYAPNAKSITVIPNAIEYELVDQIPAIMGHDGIYLGWFGTATHQIDLEVVMPVIADILKKYKQVTFIMGGWPDCPLIKDLPQEQVKIIPWTDDMFQHYTNLKQLDIAICPLADIKFNESKSNLKFMEYSSLAIPVVASDLLPYQGSIKDGVNGFLARARGATYKAWMKPLEALINDADLRKKIGKTGASSTRARYAQDKVAEKWATFYEKILLDKKKSK
jgi:glycosyltransferase involved in cell wall biosynthesis